MNITLPRIAAAAVLAASLGAAHAAPVPALHAVNWKAANDHLLTRDVASGLDWLDITQTVGYGGAAFAGTTAAGGIFEGFRMATRAEFNALLGRAGLGTSWGAGAPGATSPDNIANARALMNLLGSFSSDSGSMMVNYAGGYLADVHVSTTWTGTVFGLVGVYDYVAPGTPDYYRAETYGITSGVSSIGRWLVRASSTTPVIPDVPVVPGGVPLPGTPALLLAAGLAALAAARRRTGA